MESVVRKSVENVNQMKHATRYPVGVPMDARTIGHFHIVQVNLFKSYIRFDDNQRHTQRNNIVRINQIMLI